MLKYLLLLIALSGCTNIAHSVDDWELVWQDEFNQDGRKHLPQALLPAY